MLYEVITRHVFHVAGAVIVKRVADQNTGGSPGREVSAISVVVQDEP